MQSDTLEKTCSKCKEVKPLDEFSPDKRAKDGRASSCRPCHREVNRQSAGAHPESTRDRNCQWQRSNPGKVQAKRRRWRQNNLEAERERVRQWARDNPEKVKANVALRRARKLAVEVEEFTHDDLVKHWMAKGIDPKSCVYCGGPYEHDDHFIPLSRDGEHSTRNLVPSCESCNSSKWAHDPYEWMTRKGYTFTPPGGS